eukprot:6851106-Karenia_brevis.AAC.1
MKYNWVRTLVSGRAKPRIQGQEGKTVQCGRGLRQGRCDSMLLFVLSLLHGVGGVASEWKRRGW